MNNEPRAGWLPSGSHAILSADFVDELQHTIGIFIAAKRSGARMVEQAAAARLEQLIDVEIGQPAVRAAG